MTKWYFFHILESCTHSHTHKQSIYVYTKKSFGISKFHRLLQYSTILGYAIYIEESESRSVEEGGESKVACCQALCSPKAEKAYTQQTLCVCSVLIPRPFFTLFNLAVTYLYHFIVVLSEVAQLPGGKVLFFSFHFISSMVCFQLFFIVPPKIQSCEIFIDDRPAALFVFIL